MSAPGMQPRAVRGVGPTVCGRCLRAGAPAGCTAVIPVASRLCVSLAREPPGGHTSPRVLAVPGCSRGRTAAALTAPAATTWGLCPGGRPRRTARHGLSVGFLLSQRGPLRHKTF